MTDKEEIKSYTIGRTGIGVALGGAAEGEPPDPRVTAVVNTFFSLMAKAADQEDSIAFERCFEAFAEETEYLLDQRFLKTLDPDFAGTLPKEFDLIMSLARKGKKPKKS